jgi:sulfatase modifying factor 1
MTTRHETHEMPSDAPGSPPHPGMVWIPGGTFKMGSDDHYAEEAPAHYVTVSGFWMDSHPVTNGEFRRFIKETGYITVAEQVPKAEDYPGAIPELLVAGALGFQPSNGPVNLHDWSQWWNWTPGASWRQPTGPGSSIAKLRRHPVVQVSYEDACAFAEWAGKELPTEAQWEFAARGGLDGAVYPWGDELEPESKPRANIWQGQFPWQNELRDGYLRTSPVGSFPANGYGLYDMTGNVWEWTTDWYQAEHQGADSACCAPENPRGPRREVSFDPLQPEIKIPRKVLKGGSHLCALNYCIRYRPAARQPEMIDTATSHIGFRCIVNAA